MKSRADHTKPSVVSIQHTTYNNNYLENPQETTYDI